MKIKKPSLSGQKNCEYLGRFSKDEFIQQGHNGTKLEDGYADAPMASESLDLLRKKQNEEWEAQRPERNKELRRMKNRRAIERIKSEMTYGPDAALREVIRSGMKRQKRY